MMFLALEFSSERRSVAVAEDGRILAEVCHEATLRTPMFRLIESVLAQAGVERGRLEALAVGLGPGSYTGIRMAISVAQGWQLATRVVTVGVNSLEALAVVSAEVPGPVLLAVDAQRGEFATAVARDGRLIGPTQLQTLDSLRERPVAEGPIAGPEIARHLPGALTLFPPASVIARLAVGRSPVPAEALTPVYLREANFVKAPSSRDVFCS